MVVIKEPIISVNISTRVSPGSENTLMTASIPDVNPAIGLNPFNSVQPIQIPAKSDRITCLVQIARTIARIGGSMEYQLGSFIEHHFLLAYRLTKELIK